MVLPLPIATLAKHWGEPPPYDLGFRACPAYEDVRVYATACIAFACAGHDLAGSCERGPYKIVLSLPMAASAEHLGEPPPYDLGLRVCSAYGDVRHLCHRVRIAFACAGHDLAGPCELRALQDRAVPAHGSLGEALGGAATVRFRVTGFPCI